MHGVGYGSMSEDLLEIKQFLPAAPPVDRQSFVILGDPTVALPPFAN
jgi:hypothetical protein